MTPKQIDELRSLILTALVNGRRLGANEDITVPLEKALDELNREASYRLRASHYQAGGYR
jgi:hypothetical protein